MKAERAESAFRGRLMTAGLHLDGMITTQGVNAMLAFYEDERADDCDIDADGDMLLFEWGSYDSGNGESFNLCITRQLIFGGYEDENIWQLRLIFNFPPTGEFRDLDAGDRWCASPDELPEFREFINGSDAFKAVTHKLCETVELNYACAG